MASVQIFTAEIRVQFQGRRCVMVDVVHPMMDAVEPCKTVFKSDAKLHSITSQEMAVIFALRSSDLAKCCSIFSLSVYIT